MKGSPTASPGRSGGPFLGRCVLRLLLPRERRDDMIGDLGEMYERRETGRVRAWMWYWKQVGDLSGRLAWERLGLRRSAASSRDAPTFGRAPRAPSRGGFLALTDLKLALRMTAKTPGFTLVAVMAMAVGIGLATCAYSFIDAVFFAQLPFPGGERIVRLENFDIEGGYLVRNDREVFNERQATLTSYEHVVGYETRRLSIERDEGGESGVVSLAYATANLFDMLGVEPLLGRGFRADDVDSGSPAVVVIGHALWQGRFGADPEIAGEVIRIDGQAHTIVGVMPEGFLFPYGQQAWIPVDTDPAKVSAMNMRLYMAAKLAPEVDLRAAEAEWRAVATRLPARDDYAVEDLGQRIVPFTRPDNETEPIVLAATAFLVLVLLVTAANVSNLLLARTSARMNEMAVRVALGGSRGRIIGQLFLEALVVGAIAATLGVAASRPILSWFRVNGGLPWWTEFRLDLGVFLFATGVTVAASAVAGLFPALKATAGGLEGILRDESSGASGLRFGRLSMALLVAQVTISIGFLSTAAIVGLGLYQQGRQDFSIPEADVIVAQIYWGQPEEQDEGPTRADTWDNFFRRAGVSRERIEERLRSRPEIVATSSSTGVPGENWIDWTDRRPIELRSGDGVSGAAPTSNIVEINPGYFETYDISVLAGRAFDAADYEGATQAAIVNEPFVRKHLPSGTPLGQRIRWGRRSDDGEVDWRPWLEIVGVIPDIGVDPIDSDNADVIYVPIEPRNIVLMSVRTRGERAALAPALYEVLATETMSAELQALYTLEELVDGPTGPLRSVGSAAVVVGGIALLLSACGLYAIMSFSVTRRTREIGIRVALGAKASGVLRSVFGRALAPLVIGSILGAALGGASTAVIASFVPLEPVQTGSSLTVVVVSLMAVVGVIGCLVPARRVLAVRPMEALRRS